ncbi:MAG: fumarylacetoacetase [Actinophytocola sp.]|nr:fumarylacetoacetase [Actinophytocola sp.]
MPPPGERRTWLDLPPESGFGVHNLPYGVFSREAGGRRRIGVAVGDGVLDIAAIAAVQDEDFAPLLAAEVLNPLLAAGRPTWRAVRQRITAWLTDPGYRPVVLAHRLPLAGLHLHLPFEVADYVDFYASEHHARNIGGIVRPDAPALFPNWKHMPIGYHGRAGSVVVSGTPVTRPRGQRKATDEDEPSFGPTRKLDIEAEVGFVVGTPSPLGESVAVDGFDEHVFGVCLVNDWSARDLQAWETVPLGPFLGKSFATSMSPWVVPLDALEPARIPQQPQEPEPLPYLRAERDWGLELAIEVRLNGYLVSHPPFSSMYWTAAQQLAHLTSNGAALRTGDFYASGTVSGPEPDERGSLLELTWDGLETLLLGDGTHRSYLNDGDVVAISATAPGPDGARISLGEVTGRVLPSVA